MPDDSDDARHVKRGPPALVEDVFARLALLGVKRDSPSIQRALFNLKTRPDLAPCSDLLWRLHYLSEGAGGDYIARCSVGTRTLGTERVHEAWDIALPKRERALEALAEEGESVELVVEQRLREKACAPSASLSQALGAVEASILYLKKAWLTSELGELCIAILLTQKGMQEALQTFGFIRKLIYYYRATRRGVPKWLMQLAKAYYSHYATLVPTLLQGRDTPAEDVADLLLSLFNIEALALTFGGDRGPLVLAVYEARPVCKHPTRTGLLWAAESRVGARRPEEIRAFLWDDAARRFRRPRALPAHISGLLLGQRFAPNVGGLVVDLLSEAFEQLDDATLAPLLVSLLPGLRAVRHDLLSSLFEEASLSVEPGRSPMRRSALLAESPAEEPSDEEMAARIASVRALCAAYPAATDALAVILGEGLVEDVVARLAPLGIRVGTSIAHRVIFDLDRQPELIPCSDLLWRLAYLLPQERFRSSFHCVAGARALDFRSTQECWDITLSRSLDGLAQLTHEGIRIEQVLERRLIASAHAAGVQPAQALNLVEDSIRLLESPQLTSELGMRAVALLERADLRAASGAIDHITRLVHYYRLTPGGAPGWLNQLLHVCYSRYAALLPTLFQGLSATPEEAARLIAEFFAIDTLARPAGDDRSALSLSLARARSKDTSPTQQVLLWATEWRLGLRSEEQIHDLLWDNVSKTFHAPRDLPDQINGLLLARAFMPFAGRMAVEILSTAFKCLSGGAAIPWMEGLLPRSPPVDPEVLLALAKVASASAPPRSATILAWRTPWEAREAEVKHAMSEDARSTKEASARELCAAYPTVMNALAILLGEMPEQSAGAAT